MPTTPDAPRAAIYVRISDDREGAGLGVARQEADCRDLAESRGWAVVAVHADNDVSAYSGRRRPAYDALLANIEGGALDVVLAWHTDRLHRSPTELERYITVSEAAHVPTWTVRAGALDLSTPSGRMVARMLGNAARYEVEHKSERARRKHLELAQAGKPNGGLRPYGYRSDRTTIDETEAAVLRSCASRILAGESLRGVAADLNAHEVATVTGVPWSATVLRATLTRARYAGLREHQGVTYPAAWPPVLPLDTHLALRALLNDPRRRVGASTGRVQLLTGLIRCGDCDKPLTSHYGGASRPAGSRISYTCPPCRLYGSAVGCDEVVIAQVLRLLADPRVAEGLADDADTAEDDLAAVNAGQSRLEEIGREFGRGDVPAAVVRAMVSEVQAGVSAAQSRLAARATRQAVMPDLPTSREDWEVLSLATQRAIVGSVLPDLRLARPTRVRRVFDPERVRLG